MKLKNEMIALREFNNEDGEHLVVYLNEASVTKFMSARLPMPVQKSRSVGG